MGTNWNRRPVQWLRRRLDATNSVDPEAKQHVLLWFQDLVDQITDDPRTQAAAIAAAGVYTEYIRLQAKALSMRPEDPDVEKVGAALMRCPVQLAKALRLIKMQGDKHTAPSKSPFAAPREQTQTELDAVGTLVASATD